jgi:hypothetical protein
MSDPRHDETCCVSAVQLIHRLGCTAKLTFPEPTAHYLALKERVEAHVYDNRPITFGGDDLVTIYSALQALASAYTLHRMLEYIDPDEKLADIEAKTPET